MLRNATLILTIILLCTVSQKTWAQSNKPAATDTTSKILKAYPNPATSRIYFEFQRKNDKVYEIIVYNFLGKKVEHFKNVSNKTELNLDNYYAGIYIYQLRDRSGNLVESGKFNVTK